MPKLFKSAFVILLVFVEVCLAEELIAHKNYTKRRKLELREDVRRMFQHAYDGYLRHASNYDELRPLTCDGHDTWGSYSLTLIDALDTLATMGNFSEFRRVVSLLETKINFDRDINVSVFETNIRIVGGLLSAHLMSKRAGVVLSPGWPCEGPLLSMAEDVARRLLPAFDTSTGMPYGTVNLRYGVPKGETPITCTAGVGTFLVEFGTLSRLTGNRIYEDVALNAIYALWSRRSSIGLFGNHIDVQSGRWTALDSGIGAGVDSFFEYLVKGAILLNRPELLQLFHEARQPIDKYLRKDDWYIWAGMNKGHVTLPIFQSLESFWPGILSIIGDQGPAIRTITKYISVWHKYGFLPEFYNIPTGEAALNREVYPLRPEMVESAMYLYRATRNQLMLELGESMLESLEYSAKTKCGYATIRNVVTHEKENRMESFFLAETTKYLYLLFDEDNFLHNNGGHAERLDTTRGECAVHAGSYIFNTEAHPMDMSALYCCHNIDDDIYANLDLSNHHERNMYRAAANERDARFSSECSASKETPTEGQKNTYQEESQSNIVVDMQIFDEYNNPAADTVLENFERVRQERELNKSPSDVDVVVRNQLTVNDLEDFFGQSEQDFKSPAETLDFVLKYMHNFTMDVALIRGLNIIDKNLTNVLGAATQNEFESRTRTLWELYELQQRYIANVQLVRALGLLNFRDGNRLDLANVLDVLDRGYWNGTTTTIDDDWNDEAFIIHNIHEARRAYEVSLVNTTAMQQFLRRIYISGTNEETLDYRPLLNATDLAKLTTRLLRPDEQRELFTHTRRIVDVRKRMTDTVDRLQTLMHDKQHVQTTTASSAPTTHAFDVSAKMGKKNIEHIVQPKSARDGPVPAGMPKSAKVSDEHNHENDNDSNSVWSQFVQKILRQTVMQRAKFDERVLHEKTQKSLQKNYTAHKSSLPYELFACEQPKFIETLAYRKHYPQTVA